MSGLWASSPRRTSCSRPKFSPGSGGTRPYRRPPPSPSAGPSPASPRPRTAPACSYSGPTRVTPVAGFCSAPPASTRSVEPPARSPSCVPRPMRPIIPSRTRRSTMSEPKVIVGVDDSAASHHALHWAVDEAARTGRELIVTHAYDWHVAGARFQVAGAYADDLRRVAEGIVDAAVNQASVRAPGVLVRGETVVGSAGPVLADSGAD